MQEPLIYGMHVHTKYSCDSEAAIESYCLTAIEKGVHAICFTDHIDFNVADEGYGYYNLQEIFIIMVHNNICLEVNTSSLRKGLTEALPDKELLSIYKFNFKEIYFNKRTSQLIDDIHI